MDVERPDVEESGVETPDREGPDEQPSAGEHPAPRRAGVPAREMWLVLVATLLVLLALTVPRPGGPADGQPAPDGQSGAQGRLEQQPDVDAGGEAVPHVDVVLERRVSGDPLALGAVDAPVVLVEWADFQCAYCAAWARETKPELVDRYVDAGLLRIEWRDFPVLGEASWWAALGGRAAAEQDAFWQFHDAMFAVSSGGGFGGGLDELTEVAAAAGLDVDAFVVAVADPDLEAAVQADVDEALALGAESTPSFIVAGTPVVGAQPLEVFERIIDDALASPAS